jgi:hypothetical protein
MTLGDDLKTRLSTVARFHIPPDYVLFLPSIWYHHHWLRTSLSLSIVVNLLKTTKTHQLIEYQEIPHIRTSSPPTEPENEQVARL